MKKDITRMLVTFLVLGVVLGLVAVGIAYADKPQPTERKESSNMSEQVDEVLFQDALDSKKQDGWKVAPNNFVEHPQFGTVYLLECGKSGFPNSPPWVGDETWCNYRVEVDILFTSKEMGFVGLDFYVQNDGLGAYNVHFSPDEKMKENLQGMGIWGQCNGAWKLWPVSQRRPHFPKGQWFKLRLDVGKTIANVYVNNESEPVYTIYDLPFSRGGFRFWAYYNSAYFRNLRITSLSNSDVKPILEDIWQNVSKLNVIRKWKVTPPQPPQFGLEGIPEEIHSAEMKWLDAEADRRGVVNLAALFPKNNTKAVIFAKTKMKSDAKGDRKCWVTYTDRLTIWCNGTEVFKGPARAWSDPGKAQYGCRLKPDQFEVKLPLESGENTILVRSEVTEPFGWGFWMRTE